MIYVFLCLSSVSIIPMSLMVSLRWDLEGLDTHNRTFVEINSNMSKRKVEVKFCLLECFCLAISGS